VKPAAPPLVTLGSDPDPNAGPTRPGLGVDNILFSRFTNTSGWPTHRIAVAYKYVGGGAPIGLPSTLYFWDQATERWYTLEAAKSLVADTIVFFDVVSLMDGTQTSSALGTPSQGSIEAYLRVTDPGAAPDGEHYFSMGADLSLF
jgi:hypothetical protein